LGSKSCRRQVLVRLARIAAVRPPRGFPTNNELFRFSTTRFISRSLILLSMGTAPSKQREVFRSVATSMQGEVEDVVGMGIVAHIDPQPRIGCFALAQHGHDRVAGGHQMGDPHTFRHQGIQRLNQIGHISAPHRLRGARDLEALPRKDVLQPVQRQLIGELAGNDGPCHALVDRRPRFGCRFPSADGCPCFRNQCRHTSCAHNGCARSHQEDIPPASSPPRRSPCAPKLLSTSGEVP
jgi:hypothetical protein